MTIGFDLDGTLTRHPKELGEMMTALLSCGHRVCVITAGTEGDGGRSRKARLHQIGILTYNDFVFCTSHPEKIRKIKELAVDVMIDDTDEILNGCDSHVCRLKVV
jgi:FMN phosphatase YigB (HAD superfamily)